MVAADQKDRTIYSERREKISLALNKAILTFTNLNEDSFDEVMTSGLSVIAEAVGLDRFSMYSYCEENGVPCLKQISRWDKRHGSLVALNTSLLIWPEIEAVAGWTEIINQNQCLFKCREELSDKEKIFLDILGDQSIYFVPVMYHKKFWGVVAFQDQEQGLHFHEGCEDLLLAVAYLWANVIIKEQVQERFNGSMEEVRRSQKTTETLNRMSSVFLSKNDGAFEDMMTEGLGIVADLADLDRVSVWRNHMEPNGLCTSQVYRWHKEFGGTTETVIGLRNIPYSEVMPEWEEKLRKGENINGPVKFLPEKEIFETYGIVSALITPIFIKGKFWGFMVYSDQRNERYFDDKCAEMMSSAGFLCANAIIRAEMEREMTRAAMINSSILEAMPIGMVVLDIDPVRILDCNEELTRMFNAPKEDIINRYFDSFSPECLSDGRDTASVVGEIMHRALTGETVRMEWPHQTADGRPVPCDLTVTRVKYENELVGLAFLYDLRHKKEMESRISRASRINQSILDSMPVGIAIFDETPKVIDCNDKLMEMFDAPKQHIIDRYFDDFTPEYLPNGEKSLDEAYRITNRAIAGEVVKVEWPHQTADGRPVPCDLTLTRVNNEDEFIGLGFLYDLRDIKKLAIDLERALKRATAASEAKGRFLSNMSHEMRTPLNTIMGMSSIGKKASDLDRKDYALEKIENASSHLLGVINDVLDMSKIEAGKLELVPGDFSFEKMLKKAVKAISLRLEQKQQKFFISVDGRIPHYLNTDDQRLTQVIINILSNAVKYTGECGTIRLNCFLKEETSGFCTVGVDISDTGIGITPEQQSRIFSVFEQADGGTARKFGGTGLGLAISKNIVEMMGGEIGVVSEIDRGSIFSFSFKAKRGEKNSDPHLDPAVNWENIKILAVDDTDDILSYLKEILKRYGVKCDVASNGAEAIKKIKKTGGYDMYFVDWKMPEIDGIELTKYIKGFNRDKKCVVIMISSTEWALIHEVAEAAGVDKFLMKPLFASDVMDCMNDCLGVAGTCTPRQQKSVKAGEFQGCRILLAEDVEINREILLASLQDTGAEIDCAGNGLEVLHMLEENPDAYELIFMDVQMPQMDGMEASRHIRKNGGSIPIIAMTANVFKEDIDQCLAAGMDDHVGKPLDVSIVLEKMRRYRKTNKEKAALGRMEPNDG